MQFVGHLGAALFFCGEHLHENYERVGQVAVVDLAATAHQRLALVGQFWGECHGYEPSHLNQYIIYYSTLGPALQESWEGSALKRVVDGAARVMKIAAGTA